MGTSLSTQALKMAETNDMDKLYQLLEKNPSLPTECHTSHGGETLLHWACFHGNQKVVQKLLDLHHLVHIATNEYEYTALHVASERGFADVISVLIQNGAVVSTLDKNKCSPLHYAILNGNFAAISLLIGNGARIDEKDKRGFNALHYACYSGHKDAVKLVLDKFREISPNPESYLECKAEGGYTPLLCASHREYNCVDGSGERINKLDQVSHAVVVDLLLSSGTDIRAVDDDGNTCLHIATMERQSSVVEVLIRAADIILKQDFLSFVNIRNTDGDTAFHLACVNGQLRIAVALVDAGADVFVLGSTCNEKREDSVKLCPSMHMYRLVYAAMLRNSLYEWLGRCIRTLDPSYIAGVSLAFKRMGISRPKEFALIDASMLTDKNLDAVIGINLKGVWWRLRKLHCDVSDGRILIDEENPINLDVSLPPDPGNESTEISEVRLRGIVLEEMPSDNGYSNNSYSLGTNESSFTV